jgi:hypothetical protein
MSRRIPSLPDPLEFAFDCETIVKAAILYAVFVYVVLPTFMPG